MPSADHILMANGIGTKVALWHMSPATLKMLVLGLPGHCTCAVVSDDGPCFIASHGSLLDPVTLCQHLLHDRESPRPEFAREMLTSESVILLYHRIT